ncbi:MAG: class I SAM-dependent methyltransferase [Alphaproteobacteria bacterium]|nr:class I SAM-dependent methyltransferase [Alphaproteobacteria bacterium]
MRQTARFWDRRAKGYAKRPVADQAAYEKKLQITRDYLRPDMEILEFGCGTGTTAIIHAPYVKHIRAIDISAKMIEIARAKAAAANVENVTFEVSTVEDFTAPEESFDVILGLNILHLLENKEAVIAKVHRMLKSGGVFVTSTVCLGETMKFFKLIGPIGRFLGLMPLVRVFTKRELEDSLTTGGFAIDHLWRPENRKSSFRSVFIVAKKPA